MEVHTTYFGTVPYVKEDTVHFSEGLFGFESLKDFLPLPFDEENDSMLLLQSIDDEDISFVLANPFTLCADYSPAPLEEDIKAVGNPKNEDISYYVICVMKESAEESTVNLKCPIMVNVTNREAKQIILENPAYTFRHRIMDIVQKEG